MFLSSPWKWSEQEYFEIASFPVALIFRMGLNGPGNEGNVERTEEPGIIAIIEVRILRRMNDT